MRDIPNSHFKPPNTLGVAFPLSLSQTLPIMSKKEIDPYFRQSPPKQWNLRRFLDKCDLEPFDTKLRRYVYSLTAIADENSNRSKRAQELLNKYHKGKRPHHRLAREWQKKRRSYIHFHKPKFSGVSVGKVESIRTINGTTFGTSRMPNPGPSKKRKVDSLFEDETDDNETGDDETETTDYETDSYETDSYETDNDNHRSEDQDNFEGEEFEVGSVPVEHEYEKCGVAESFLKNYQELDPVCKWVLASGMVVEDVLFKKYKDVGMELLAHSWIIDLGDHETASLFSPADWKEISSLSLSLPQLDELTAKVMLRFAGASTTAKLREILETTSYRPKDEPYVREKHYDPEWVHLVMHKMLTLFENPDKPLLKPHLEGWYDANIWSLIVDHCLHDLKRMETVRKESTSLATKMRKNRKRLTTVKGNRAKLGRRFDAIIKTDGNDYYEYGAIEVAKSFEGVMSTKWLNDNLKLAKALRDMFFRLNQLVDNHVKKELQVVGLVNSGLKCQVVRMNNPRGYVCLLKREELHEVPVDIEQLSNLFRLLKSVWQMKTMIKNCASTVKHHLLSKMEAKLLEELTGSEVTLSVSPPRTGVMPWTFDTPDKPMQAKPSCTKSPTLKSSRVSRRR
ncbi:hypothetical protein BC938DRAFT_474912 [Jimgerdemannia flammicorona]|uniref:Uncharacterized protein n=1 Tax=Jimgerdemannia flammicorona TaxID=994334 RepID=A0A433QS78_9FUNG|nr:hypothetical protein BC938DRAFT_474912 [Jimgerdemannia flammicorona]